MTGMDDILSVYKGEKKKIDEHSKSDIQKTVVRDAYSANLC